MKVTIKNGTIIKEAEKVKTEGIFSALFNEVVVNVDYEALAKEYEQMAKSGHENVGSGRHYQNRTGDLEDATYAKYVKDIGIEIGYDEAKATHRDFMYGEFVRHGKDLYNTTWEGDDFIGEAVENVDIKDYMQKEVDKGSRKASRFDVKVKNDIVKEVMKGFSKIFKAFWG